MSLTDDTLALLLALALFPPAKHRSMASKPARLPSLGVQEIAHAASLEREAMRTPALGRLEGAWLLAVRHESLSRPRPSVEDLETRLRVVRIHLEKGRAFSALIPESLDDTWKSLLDDCFLLAIALNDLKTMVACLPHLGFDRTLLETGLRVAAVHRSLGALRLLLALLEATGVPFSTASIAETLLLSVVHRSHDVLQELLDRPPKVEAGFWRCLELGLAVASELKRERPVGAFLNCREFLASPAFGPSALLVACRFGREDEVKAWMDCPTTKERLDPARQGGHRGKGRFGWDPARIRVTPSTAEDGPRSWNALLCRGLDMTDRRDRELRKLLRREERDSGLLVNSRFKKRNNDGR